MFSYKILESRLYILYILIYISLWRKFQSTRPPETSAKNIFKKD